MLYEVITNPKTQVGFGPGLGGSGEGTRACSPAREHLHIPDGAENLLLLMFLSAAGNREQSKKGDDHEGTKGSGLHLILLLWTLIMPEP